MKMFTVTFKSGRTIELPDFAVEALKKQESVGLNYMSNNDDVLQAALLVSEIESIMPKL